MICGEGLKEKQRQAFRAIKWSTRMTDTNVAITQVTETINGTSHLRSSKDAVETAIVTANDAKYRQTVDTPLQCLPHSQI